jgi:hypothetical protein
VDRDPQGTAEATGRLLAEAPGIRESHRGTVTPGAVLPDLEPALPERLIPRGSVARDRCGR